MASFLLAGLVFSLFQSDLIMGIDACEFRSSSGGPNHLVIEGPSSYDSRVAASLDDVNSPSSSIRSVPEDEKTHASPRKWAPVCQFRVHFAWHHGRHRMVGVCF
jgi:hypothetical protein